MTALYLACLRPDGSYEYISENAARVMLYTYKVPIEAVRNTDLAVHEIPTPFLDRYMDQIKDTLRDGSSIAVIPGSAIDHSVWYSSMTKTCRGINWGMVRVTDMADDLLKGLSL